MFQMHLYSVHDNFSRALFAHAKLKEYIARIIEKSTSREEIFKYRSEISEQASTFLESLLWTRDSTLWKTAFKMVSDLSRVKNIGILNELYNFSLLSAICTRLMFSEINSMIAARKLHKS